ncbi:MAG: tRNA (adenosine(37)-N6)-threonylcarbamoyltransferase complex dimerization subunit type 1 TsaB [Candidatus Berkiellales bacterium]
MKPTILAIETATHACSAALIHQGQLFSRFQLAPKEHTHLIFKMIEELLQEAFIALKDLTALAVGQGPGSFTGVRIAMSVAQGLAFGLNLPIYPISTLAALAKQARENYPNATVISLLDARMEQVYAGFFEANQMFGEEILCHPAELMDALSGIGAEKIIAIGSGWDVYAHDILAKNPLLQIQHLPGCYPHAKDIGLLALAEMEQRKEGVAAVDVQPVYLRDKVAEKQI